MKILFVLILCLNFVLLTSCDNSDNKKQIKSKRVKNVPNIMVEAVAYRDLSVESIVTGVIKPYRTVSIFNQIEGVIEQLPFYEGDHVKKNQTIVTLDKSLIQLELNKAIIYEKQAKLNLNRIKKLVPKKLVSEDEVSQAQTLYSLAKNEMQKQKILLSHTNIKSPFNGVISQRLNESGDVISEHSHILSLIDIEKLLVEFSLSEQFFIDSNKNDKVEVLTHSSVKHPVYASIIRKHPQINDISRRGIVEALIQTKSEHKIKLIAGQLIRIKYKSKAKKYLTIPVSSIRHNQKSAYVYILNKDKMTVNKKPITLGTIINQYSEVIDGLSSGDLVVTKGQYGLKEGKEVQVIKKQ